MWDDEQEDDCPDLDECPTSDEEEVLTLDQLRKTICVKKRSTFNPHFNGLAASVGHQARCKYECDRTQPNEQPHALAHDSIVRDASVALPGETPSSVATIFGMIDEAPVSGQRADEKAMPKSVTDIFGMIDEDCLYCQEADIETPKPVESSTLADDVDASTHNVARPSADASMPDMARPNKHAATPGTPTTDNKTWHGFGARQMAPTIGASTVPSALSKTPHPTATDWLTRHTSDKAVAAGVAGCLFSSTNGFSTVPHTCCNIQNNGQACHVGLYHLDPAKAEAILKQRRLTFLQQSGKQKAEEAFKAMHLPLDGAGEKAREAKVSMASIALDHGEVGINVLTIEDNERGESIFLVTDVHGAAKMQTNVMKGDEIIDAIGVDLHGKTGTFQLIAAETGSIELFVRRWQGSAAINYVIGQRYVCKDVFQSRYPISDSTMIRLGRAKLDHAEDIYALRPCNSDIDSASNRGIRGQICVAWIRKCAEEMCEHIPDVRMRRLPHKKLVSLWHDYREDQLATPANPPAVELDQFRRIFHKDSECAPSSPAT